jgi:predicted nucleic acid-binding protein
LLESFLDAIMSAVEIILIPAEEFKNEIKIRHVKDRPILRAAMAENVDIIVSGDNDFLEAGLTKPKIMTPADFVNFSA